MRTFLVSVAVCLLMTSVVAKPSKKAINRIIKKIQIVAEKLETCKAQLITTTPAITTPEMDLDFTTTPGLESTTQGGMSEEETTMGGMASGVETTMGGMASGVETTEGGSKRDMDETTAGGMSGEETTEGDMSWEEGAGSKRDIDLARRAEGNEMKQLKAQLKFLKEELGDCMEKLDD